MITAERLMLVGGVTAFLLTIHWVRNRDLREKYAVGWVVLASLLLLLGLFPEALIWAAQASRLSYTAAVLFLALTLIYLFSFMVSVSMTRQYRRNIRLTQELAIMEQRLRLVEQRLERLEAEMAPAPLAETAQARNGVCH